MIRPTSPIPTAKWEKKIVDLEALIKELSKNKGHNNKEVDIDDESLKPLHSQDMKPPRNLVEAKRSS